MVAIPTITGIIQSTLRTAYPAMGPMLYEAMNTSANLVSPGIAPSIPVSVSPWTSGFTRKNRS